MNHKKTLTTHFGPYFIDLSPSLIIDHLSINLESDINHFWGENGVGKSTFLKFILEDLKAQNTSFSYIDQNYRQSWLWWCSIEKNLMLATGTSRIKDLYNLSQICEQLHWLNRLIKVKLKDINLASEEYHDAYNLSGGQLQKLILFREMLSKPKYMLLDEVFSALDQSTIAEIATWLLQEQKKYKFKLISISHNPMILDLLPGDVFNFSHKNDSRLQIHKKGFKN
ncbi:MAG: ATP-binding cassette domain-containing protein [Patescibacteria group bacterium]